MNIYEAWCYAYVNQTRDKLFDDFWLFFENCIDKVLLDKKYADKEWFLYWKFEPYLRNRFNYHYNLGDRNVL